MDDQLLSITEAAERLGATPRTVRDWLWYGKLKGLKIGGRWKVPVSSIEAFLEYPEPHPPRKSHKPASPLTPVNEAIAKAGLCTEASQQNQLRRQTGDAEFYPPLDEA